MSKSKKFLALLAAGSLAVGGVAWASVQSGTITPNTQATNLTDVGQYVQHNDPFLVPADYSVSYKGFGVVDGTQSGNMLLPTAWTFGQATDGVVTIGVNAVPLDANASRGKSHVTQFWQLPGTINGFNRTGGNPVGGTLNYDAPGAATFVVNGDGGGVIELAPNGNLTIQPSTGNWVGGAIKDTSTAAAAVGDNYDPAYIAFSSTQGEVTPIAGSTGTAQRAAGMLRIRDGNVTIYGANNNSPTAAVHNNFNGGTFLMAGTLNIAHSNAFGMGHVMLGQGTAMRIFGNDTSLGYKAYDAAQTSLSTTQNLYLRRNATNAADRTTRRNTTIQADGVDFSVYSGVREFLTAFDRGAFDAVTEDSLDNYETLHQQPTALGTIYGATMIKTGSNPMLITSDLLGGAWHTRGTTVSAGELNVKSTGTRIYAASLGRTWVGNPAYDEDALPALTNYKRAVEGAPAPLASNKLAVPYKNYLTVDANAKLTLNRDQFFGQFSGKGAFHVDSWNFAKVPGGVKLPQITIQTDASYSQSSTSFNNYTNGDFSEENVFSGPMTGTFDLVLNTGYLANVGYPVDRPSNLDAIIPNASETAWRKVLKLTGADNNITSGDTTIVNGILSVRTVENLPPGSIFVGANGDRNTYKAHLSHVGGFDTTVNPMMATLHANGSFATRDGQLVTVGTKQMNNNMQERTRQQPNDYVYPGPRRADGQAAGEPDDHAVLAGDRGTKMELGNVEVYSAFVVNEEFRVSENILNTPRGWEGEIHFTDRYIFPNSTVANPTNVTIDRGMLHLEKLPADITKELLNEKGHFDIQINPTGVLSLGEAARDFSDVLNVTFGAARGNAIGEDDQRIRVIVKQSDIYTSKADARLADAIFQAGHIDYVGLGTGESNRDKRIVVQLDLSQVGNKIAKGTWIKVIESPQAINWNNLHFLRESSNTQDEDYAKVRVAYTSDVTIDGDHVRARLDENTYAIYIYADADVNQDTDPVDETNFAFTNTTATNSLIEGSVNLADASIGNVASADVTVYLFHGGVNTSDNSLAVAHVSGVTNASGTMAYSFTPDADGFGYSTNYTLKAVSAGYKDGTRSITTDASDIIWSDSSSGCDAGFGIFALIAAAGGALVLRKKD